MICSVGFIFSSLGAGEILLVLAVVLLFFGAERLPEIARILGQAINKIKRAANDFSSEFTNSDNFPHSGRDVADRSQRREVKDREEKREG